MKHTNLTLAKGLAVITIAAFAMLNLTFMLGCSSSGSGGGGSTTANGVPLTGTGGGTTGTGTSGTANVTYIKSGLDYYATQITNNPTNVQVAVNLNKLGSAPNGAGGYDYEFGGTLEITFQDGANNYDDVWDSSLQGGPNTVSTNTQNNQINLVSTQYPGLGGLPGYHGYFQGKTYCSYGGSTFVLQPGQYCPGNMLGGAVILVLDSIKLDADGQGATTGTGSLWVYNIVAGNGTGPMPGTSCWFIQTGPYDCQTWLAGPKSSLVPSGGKVFKEIGTFTGLDLTTAFNGGL